MVLNRKIKLPLILTLLVVLLLTGCREKAPDVPTKPVAKSNYLLGTVIDITIHDKNDDELFSKAFGRISEIEEKMTINNAETSEVIALNNASGKDAVKLSPDTLYVMERGRYYSELSGGKFDITIGPIVKLWNIGTDAAAVPDSGKLVEAVGLVDYNKLTLNKENSTARLEVPGMKVDLGAIAKGYAADEVARILRENGVKHAIINLGGNILVIGGNPKGAPWKIGIQDPFNPRGDFLGIVPVQDQTVVTSGTYERYFEENGKTYHHILDSGTGYPVNNNLHSVSIITGKSIDGDGLSTTSLLLGLEEGMKFIESQENTEAVFVTSDKQVYVTSGLKEDFILVSSAFKRAN